MFDDRFEEPSLKSQLKQCDKIKCLYSFTPLVINYLITSYFHRKWKSRIFFTCFFAQTHGENVLRY